MHTGIHFPVYLASDLTSGVVLMKAISSGNFKYEMMKSLVKHRAVCKLLSPRGTYLYLLWLHFSFFIPWLPLRTETKP